MTIKLDLWQKEFLETEGDKILYCGRQVGKSVICAMDAGEYAVTHPNQVILMIAPVERQAYALFDKTLDYLAQNYPNKIMKGKHRPTLTKIQLTNGTIIWCLPTGTSGIGIRFLTVNRLYGEEASRIEAEIWNAVTPMLLTTGGSIVLLTTPAGKGTYASDVWNNKNDAFNSFKRFSAESEKVVRERTICDTWTQVQRDKALVHIERERARMTKNFFAQEYEGKEMDELRQFFNTELIKSCLTVQRVNSSLTPSSSGEAGLSPGVIPGLPASLSGQNYLGVDVAGMGSDDTVLFSLHKEDDKLVQNDMEITNRTLLTQTVRTIKQKDAIFDYKSIYIDTGGMGVGIFDPLLEDEQTKRKVVPIDNSTRSLNSDNSSKRRLIKEDLYNNLLNLMENHNIQLYNDDEILRSLRSIQFEYVDGNLKIFSDYGHITEALVRAAWCMKDKHLNIYLY